MPSVDLALPKNRKRHISDAQPETDRSPQLNGKRQRLEDHQRHQTPNHFWDNLSRQWLTRRTLREFDRRTVWPAVPIPPQRTDKNYIDFVKLKRFARHGGPELGAIRGYQERQTPTPSCTSSQSGSRKRAKTGRASSTLTSTRRASAYDAAFEQHLIDHGIYPHKSRIRNDGNIGSLYPDNREEIKKRLAQPRASLSPSRFTEEDFEKFEERNTQALTETKVMSKVFPMIAGTADIPSQENLRFTNLDDLTDGSITDAQPDHYDGIRPEHVDKHIREELGPYIVPSTNTAAPCLPNFFSEGKGQDGPGAVNKLQACYDGALGERAMNTLLSYNNPEAEQYNIAHTITSTYHGGLLRIYSMHASQTSNPKHPIEYRMTQLRGWDITDSADKFREGATALRNARDWAKERREELVAMASNKFPDTELLGLVSCTQSFESPSSNKLPQESETSVGEPSKPRVASTQKPRATPGHGTTPIQANKK